jgi:hypothetical protein
LRRSRTQQRLRGAKPGRSVVERARDLVAGGRVEAISPAEDLRACDLEEFEILRPAIGEATRKLDEVHGDLSFPLCQRLKPQYGAALVAALYAMEDLSAALDAAAAIRARVRAGGYAPLSTVLPDTIPVAALQLGNPAAVGMSQAAFFKKILQEAGLL